MASAPYSDLGRLGGPLVKENIMRPLEGVRVIEMAGLAPAPYAGMILADFGADVVRVDRPAVKGTGFDPTRDYLARGKRSVAVNIKDPRGAELALKLCEGADVLIEPYRPGVMEKLGLGPEPTMAANPSLIYARLTGWGQDGPYAAMAGHDINYIAISGALGVVARRGERPLAPVNMLGDFAGGGMLCAMGIVLALFERTRSGVGQVVDAAMVDGAANLAAFLYGFHAAGYWSDEAGTNLLDSGSHFYDTYETADGKHMAVGAIEPQFYAELLDGLGLANEDLPHQMDRGQWPAMKEKLAEVFKTKTRQEWTEIFDSTDACVAPVMNLGEAPSHPHNQARAAFVDGVNGDAAPQAAPRLSRTPGHCSGSAPLPGEQSDEVLAEAGLSDSEIAELRDAAVIA